MNSFMEWNIHLKESLKPQVIMKIEDKYVVDFV